MNIREIHARQYLPDPRKTSLKKCSIQINFNTGIDFVRVTTENGPAWFLSGSEPKPFIKQNKTKIFKREQPRKLPSGEYELPIESGFVYLIKFNGLYKIGMSKNFETRIKQLDRRWKMRGKYEVVRVISTTDMINLECKLHQKFHDKCIHAEWFDLSLEDVDYIMRL